MQNEEGKQRLLERLERDFGPICMAALNDPKVVEVMRNADGAIWLDVAGTGLVDTGYVMPAAAAGSILAVSASLAGTTLTKENPVLETTLELNGARLEGLIPPVTSSPTFAIRKKASRVFTLEEYAERGILPPGAVEALKAAVRDKANILIVGSTGSGKTTLANALIHSIGDVTPDDRIVAIEMVAELQLPVKNHLVLQASETLSMDRCLKATMRLRPDRIIVGEVRGREAYTLLKAWNSGHPGGMATIHADNAQLGLHKLADYVFEAPEAHAFPEKRMGRSIASAVQVVLFITKADHPAGRVVSEICRVRGFTDGSFDLEPLSLN